MYLVDKKEWNRPSDSKNLLFKGWTPLHWAAFTGQDAIVKVLLKLVNDTMPKTGFGYTPLHVSATEGFFNVTKDLLDAIEDPTNINPHACKEAEYWTPLHFAAASQHQQIVELIMDRHRASAYSCRVHQRRGG